MFMALSLFNRVVVVLIAVAVVAGGWFLYFRERNNFAEYRAATIAAAKAQQDKTNIITKAAKHSIRKQAFENYTIAVICGIVIGVMFGLGV